MIAIHRHAVYVTAAPFRGVVTSGRLAHLALASQRCTFKAALNGRMYHPKDELRNVSGSILQNSRHAFQLRSINNAIKPLLRPHGRVVNTPQLYEDDYYRQVFLKKQMFEGVDLVSIVEKISKKQATHLLLEAGC